MSNHWDLLCRTCDAKCDLEWNHGGDDIQELIGHLPALAQAVPGFEVFDRRFYGSLPWELLRFARQHHAHDLIAVDEYGDVYGACGDIYYCACCKARLHCKLPKDHDGDHRQEAES